MTQGWPASASQDSSCCSRWPKDPKHGYAITSDVMERTGIKLGPGTLYSSIGKLEQLGLIAAVPSDDRRRPYEITSAGRAALIAQLQTWERIVTTGRARVAWA